MKSFYNEMCKQKVSNLFHEILFRWFSGKYFLEITWANINNTLYFFSYSVYFDRVILWISQAFKEMSSGFKTKILLHLKNIYSFFKRIFTVIYTYCSMPDIFWSGCFDFVNSLFCLKCLDLVVSLYAVKKNDKYF